MTDVKSSLLDGIETIVSDGNEKNIELDSDAEHNKESFADFCKRQMGNVLYFLMEDWCLSAMLGIITAILSVVMDICIEKLQHSKISFNRHYQILNMSTKFS
ncbi:unnamed protein product [Onchocerca ochengi]|uniref:ABC transmembrane type-1 domain-containing protein n=1 Tax=Onchocerca ochengi TaxID=42157 RepID=A0A182EMF9_ONCOC|nr:unnamed protein product [Onchocerca ochengi]